MARLRMAVIGVGHLGSAHARVVAGLPDVELVGVVDTNAEQAGAVAQRLGTEAFAELRPLLGRLDAATVAASTRCHAALATELLQHRIPVLVEKPLAATLEEAEALVELSQRQQTILQVGHIERFNPAFEELTRRRLQPKFVTCERLGPFSGRSTDTSVVLDLMIHDLDLLLALVRSPVRRVEALGLRLLSEHEDMAGARLLFANGCVANVTASRAHPTAVRRMQIWAPEGYVRLDFHERRLTLVQPSEELKQRHAGRKPDATAQARLKDEWYGRYLETLELHRPEGDQLTLELQDFVSCVRERRAPRVGGREGLMAMALATRVLESIRTHPWEGTAHGATGPLHLPAPLGPLFEREQGGAAA